MTKDKLIEKTNKVVNDTHDALTTIWQNINKGQQKQLIKIPEIKEILDRYNVDYSK